MDLSVILMSLAAKYPILGVVLVVLGGLVIAGQAYIAFTPTKDDDAWYARLEAKPFVGQLLSALRAFAPIQRKEVKLPEPEVPPQA